MASPGRKFLLAGRGGLNLTHSEPRDAFMSRYADAASWLGRYIEVFPPDSLRAWCEGLGQAVFVGSSGRVFPTAFKAAPLLRAWLRRLDSGGVRFAGLHQWLGFAGDGDLRFGVPGGEIAVRPDATLLALGGASWPRMGADGAWVPIVRAEGVTVRDLSASNCGVIVPWSGVFAGRFEGQPLKRIALSAGGRVVRGEAVIARTGMEGGAVYAIGPVLREQLSRTGRAVTFHVDLRPDVALGDLAMRLSGPRQGRSLGNFLRQRAGLSPVAIGLVQEALHAGAPTEALASLIKAVPVPVTGLAPMERAISSAGGIAREELDEQLMIRRLPGVFAAGEMLDWDAPTGGYLLQACFSTGVAAAEGIKARVRRP